MKLESDQPMETESAKVEIRPMASEMTLLSQPDGSASFSQGDTTVLAAVYGPAEVKVSKELIDRANVEVIFKPKVGMPSCSDKLHERLIRNTCASTILTAMHPRTSITVVLQEMQDSGCLIACCINAACLAMMDAAIQMNFMTAAVSCAFNEEGTLVMDPDKEQLQTCPIHMIFAFDSKDCNLVASKTVGEFTQAQYDQCLDTCRAAAPEIFKYFRDCMTRKLSKTV